LALHYLDKERFALWALMASIAGYLNLVDLGMSGSFAFHLIDRKDDRSGGGYGSLILTGWLVLLAQGALVFGVCFALAPWLGSLLDIPLHLRPAFVGLMRWQGAVVGLNFATRMFNQLLYSHQRLDISNYTQVGGLALNLVLLGWFFHTGQGVFSLVWAMLLAACASAAVAWVACWRLKLFPERGTWGRPSARLFKELFTFGKDLFLVSVGTQLILFSQTMVITRRLGLEVAALWAVGTKGFNLLIQLIWRTTDAPLPGFAEMMARGERQRLLERYRTVVMFSLSIAGYCAVSYALCNSPFVTVWTNGKFSWPAINDLLLGLCMLVSGLARCHNWFISATKQLRLMPYVFCAEGAAFILISLAVARVGQLQGVILTSLGCSLLFTLPYGVLRVARFFGLAVREVGWHWLLPTRRFMWRFVLAGLGTWLITRSLPPMARFLLNGLVCGTVGLGLLARHGLPPALQTELVQRLPARVARLLAWLFNYSGPSKAMAVSSIPKA
jgi:O-antigen/teichoic acid export membrane protein